MDKNQNLHSGDANCSFRSSGALAAIVLPLTIVVDSYWVLQKGRSTFGIVVADRLFPAPAAPNELANLGKLLITMFLLDYLVYLLIVLASFCLLNKVRHWHNRTKRV